MPLLKVANKKVALEVDFAGPLTIGRHIANSLPLPDNEVSRYHAAIFPEREQYTLADNNSRNGVFVNGIKAGRHQLQAGDEIIIGSTLLFFDPPAKTETEELLSPKGKALWSKLPGPPGTRIFAVTTHTRDELEEGLDGWLNRQDTRRLLPMSLYPEFMRYLMAPGSLNTATDLYKGTVDFLQRLCRGERVALVQARSQKSRFLTKASIGFGDGSDGLDIPQDILRIIVDAERAVYCNDTSRDFRFQRLADHHGEDRFRAFIGIPVFANGRYYGFLYADQSRKAEWGFASLLEAYVLASLFGGYMHWYRLGQKAGRAAGSRA